MHVNEQGTGWSTALPMERGKTSFWPGHGPGNSGLETGWQEWSHPVVSGKRVGVMYAMAFGLGVKGWGLVYLCISKGVFCKWKPSLISNSNILTVNQCSIQPTAVTDVCCSRGRWKRGLGSIRSALHCMGERKSLLIMSAGTDAFLELMPPHVSPWCLARTKGMTALTPGDSLSHRGAAFPCSSSSNQLANKHMGAHSSAWPSKMRESVSFLWFFWQAPTEMNGYTKSQLFFC